MARGHLTRSPSGHLTRQAGRSPDSASGSTVTLADGLADFLVSGRDRGLSPKTLDWFAMIGERFAAFRLSRGADPARGARAWPRPGLSSSRPRASRDLSRRVASFASTIGIAMDRRATGESSRTPSSAGSTLVRRGLGHEEGRAPNVRGGSDHIARIARRGAVSVSSLRPSHRQLFERPCCGAMSSE